MVKIINYKNKYGNFHQRVYTFKSYSHLENWCNVMNKKGYKIIGIED